MTERYDVLVIGGGPGGYVAAIRAAQLGFKTVCIEKRKALGGTCLNVGCIPSKSLLEATHLLKQLKEKGEDFGIKAEKTVLDFPQMMRRKDNVVHTLTEGIAGLFKKNKIFHFIGNASFISPQEVLLQGEAEERRISADFIILATGSAVMELPHLPFDEKKIVSSTGALSLQEIPQRMLVIGGGVIGVELASVYARLGSSVTIVEMLPTLCPMLDPSLSHQLLQALKKQGIRFELSSKVVKASLEKDGVEVVIQKEGEARTEKTDLVLVAVGRKPYVQGLGLEKIGISLTKNGHIPVDNRFRTIYPHIFAIGDVIEGVMLAHRASAEAVSVVDSLKGISSIVDYSSVPNVIYTDPEVATVGFTEEEAKSAKRELLIGKSYFKGNSRSRCCGELEGFVKIIGDKKTGVILGMHIIGPHASELIAEGMLALQKKMKIEDLAQAAQAHPTLSETIKEAALDALGYAVHQ